MPFQNLPIKRKVTLVIMLTSVTVLLLTVAAFMFYDWISYRQNTVLRLSTTASIVADSSTAALLFQDEETAQQLLNALHAESQIIEAALYDDQGKLYVRYPTNRPVNAFPAAPGKPGYSFEGGRLTIFQAAIQDNRRAGILYLQSDLRGLYQRLRLYSGIAAAVLAGSIFVALLLSTTLQRRITSPILALADVARLVSLHRDYSTRAIKTSQDELGVLTDAFNSMLTRIEEQTAALKVNEERLRLAMEGSRTGAWDWNLATGKITGDATSHRLVGINPDSFKGTAEELKDLIHPEDRARLKTEIDRAMKERTELFTEFRVTWPDQSIHHLSARGRALYDPSGRPVRMNGIILDLTESKRAEESISFLAAIVNSSDDAVIGKNLQSQVISWNAGAERMFGYSTAEMLGQPITRLLSPDRPEEEPEIIKLVNRDSIRHLDTIRIHKDGHPVEVSLTVSPIKNLRGEIIGVSSIARDITERRRAQEALERHTAVLREQSQMLDLANVLARDLNDRIILWNTGMETMYGWRKSEALNKVSHELFRTQFPEPYEHIRNAILTLGRWDGELIHFRKDGQRIIVNSQQVLHTDPEGKPIAILEVNNDITERKRAEQRQAAFARLGRSLSEAASATAAAHTIADVADELIGWDACSLDLYSTADDLIHPIINVDTVDSHHTDVPPAYDRQPPSPIARKVLTEGAQIILREPGSGFASEAVPFGDKTKPSASLMYVPVRLGQTVIGILSIQSYRPNAYTQGDLTTLQNLADQCAGALERIRAEENVRKLNEELEQRVEARTADLRAANQELEAFTYSVAHDLRAPLRHVDAFSRILAEDFGANLPLEAKRYLDNIRNGSRNMSHLVDDLLNLARVGRQELKRHPTPLSGLVNEVMADLKPETEGRTIEWHVHPLPTIDCDSGLIKQVFTNLLSNAVKYTRPRKVAVIEVGADRPNGNTALFVRDNGVGFNMKYADKLFGVFQRLHRSEEFEGTGVGLATVDRIVRKHGGAIWAEAQENHGATFYFTLAGLGKPPSRG